jgi:hypothetical protein
VAIAPGGNGVVHNKEFADADSVYGNAAKRRRTTAEKKEAAARKAALEQQAAQEAAAGVPYSITNPLPWAEKEVKVGEPQQLCPPAPAAATAAAVLAGAVVPVAAAHTGVSITFSSGSSSSSTIFGSSKSLASPQLVHLSGAEVKVLLLCYV